MAPNGHISIARATVTVTASHLEGDVRDAFARVLARRAAELLTESRHLTDA